MTLPVFSILSPVFNEEAHIRKMIDSVLAQSVSSWQLIFVDDGSTDSTAAVIMEYVARDSRIVLAGAGKHIGKVAAINLAFAKSQGQLLFHLGGDDYIEPDSLQRRSAVFHVIDSEVSAGQAAFFKMRTFSDVDKYDDLILPRGRCSSRSGASPTYSRDLAEIIFPIPEHLPSEDLWIGFLAETMASRVHESTDVAWRYRIHAGNSNPRHKPFKKMCQSIAARAEVWPTILQCDRFTLSNGARRELEVRWSLEQMRRRGRLYAILGYREARFIDRLAVCSAAHPILFWVRMVFYRHLTGLRGA